MYFSVSIITWIVGHDVGCYVCWFATWGVPCHLTITKILKLSCRGVAGMGIGAVVDLHEQSICQTPYNLNVVP